MALIFPPEPGCPHILVVGGGVLLAAVLVLKKKGQGEVEESV